MNAKHLAGEVEQETGDAEVDELKNLANQNDTLKSKLERQVVVQELAYAVRGDEIADVEHHRQEVGRVE